MSQQLVFDASALIAAAKTELNGRLVLDDVLRYAQVVVPARVVQETVEQGLRRGYADATVLDRRTRRHKMAVLTLSSVDRVFEQVIDKYELEEGDKEVLKTCRELPGYANVIVDDRLLYIVLHRFGMRPWFLLDLIVAMFREGTIDLQTGQGILTLLRPRYRAGFVDHSLEQLKGRV